MKSLLLFFLTTTSLIAAEQKPYRVYLKPGIILTKISDKKEVRTTKGIYANVLETSPTRREHFIVYDKTGKPAYMTNAENITDIANEIQLLPNVDANITYPAPMSHQSDDKIAFLDTNFNMHLESYILSAFNTIYPAEATSVIAPRFEVRTMYNSDLPVNFGIGFNYQNVNFKTTDDDDINFTIFSFGPQIERVIYTKEILAVTVVGGGEFAPIYKAVGNEFTEKYSALLFNIGVEGTWDTRFGKWSLGTHWRHHDLTLTETNRTDINPVPESISTNSIGIMAGYKYEWNL